MALLFVFTLLMLVVLVVSAYVSMRKENQVRVLRLETTHRPPRLTLQHFESNYRKELDPTQCRYSPRWPAERMAQELLDYACRSCVELFPRSAVDE